MTVAVPARVYVGLGGNLGDVEATLTEALMALDMIPQTTVRGHSRLYRTPAWGKTDQPSFLNAVAELQTRLSPRILLERFLAIEQRFGRTREDGKKWGPRALDLDMLVYAGEILDEPGLHLPHPHLHERAFVLVPLAEIAPDVQVPGHGRVARLAARIGHESLRPAD